MSAKHDWAILQWDEPEVRGSLPIIGYILECKIEDAKWAQMGPDLILGTRTEISGLDGGIEHRFRVRAVTEYGNAAASITTDALVPWVPLAVAEHLQSSERCFEEDEKLLRCKFTLTEEQEKAEWYLESDLIDFESEPFRNRFENLSDGHWRVLKLKKAELDDSGLYICKIGNFTTETILEVEPKPPTFNVRFESAEVGFGNDWTFKCQVDKPDLNVLWLKNGVELPESSRYITEWDGEDELTHRLTIKDIEEADQAEYSAYIVGTEAICSANLTVDVPKFEMELEKANVISGNCHTFKCSIERQEVAVTWLKNGNELENGDKYSISTDGRWHYCEIRNISIEDEGEYIAKIKGSSFESMAALLVETAKVRPEVNPEVSHSPESTFKS